MNRRAPALPPPATIAPAVSLFSVLAHPMRLQLLVALSRRGPLSAGELQQLVGGEQSAVSHQLATLRRARLVIAEPNGRQRVYSLADHHVAHIVEDALAHANERKRRAKR